MQLHEFMSQHHDEILGSCNRQLHYTLVSTPNIDAAVEAFFEEVRGALKRECGYPESVSPLPTRSDAASRLGHEPQAVFLEPGKVPMIFGTLSQAIGEVGVRYDLEISAAEYKVFNHCIDIGVANCIEHYWDRELQDQRQQVSDSFGYLAHELRVALGNACLAFKLLRTGDVGVNGRTADVMANNLARMENLVSRTLGEAQLEAGAKPAMDRLRVATVLRKLQASFIPERGIQLVLEVDEGLYVAADELLLTSAVSNLLSNAIKFSHSGSNIALRSYDDGESTVLEVQDECGGLRTADPDKLLLPFVKGDEHPSNFGLGLSITKRSVEAMHGRVRITNLPGHGCIFALLLPHAVPRIAASA